MSSTPTLHKSPWTSKVNSFLYVTLDMTLWNGILLDHRHFVLRVRTSTSPREDGQGARGMESGKTVAWKRRRKKSQEAVVLPPVHQRYYRYGPSPMPSAPHRYCRRQFRIKGPRARTSGTTAVRPVLPPRQAKMPAPPVLPPPLPHKRTSGAMSGTTAATPVLPPLRIARSFRPAPAVLPSVTQRYYRCCGNQQGTFPCIPPHLPLRGQTYI